MKRVIDCVVKFEDREIFIPIVESIRYDKEHGDLVIHSYGVVNYLKNPENKVLTFKIREIK